MMAWLPTHYEVRSSGWSSGGGFVREEIRLSPAVELPGATVYLGSCLDILPTLADNSVDAVVTDPPYELGFMGKAWDSSGIAFNVEVWRECLRVLKPGGHLLAFGGSRTWHRIAVAIEDAGFEVRDSIAWLYGSGFPKSLDVSKAIDKSDASEMRRKRDLDFTAWIRSTGLTAKRIDEITETNMGSHYTTKASQPAVATSDLFDKLRPYLPEVPDYIEQMVADRTIESENFKNRKVIGQKTGTKSVDGSGHGIVPGGITETITLDITSPATPDSAKWAGWGTALKPAFEPVVVARKPLIGTVAANVLEWGTGAINIDGTRIGGESGRWPANVMLDEYTAQLLDEQSGVSKSPETVVRGVSRNSSQGASNGGTQGGYNFGGGVTVRGHGDSGGASRFFYVAKASKRDRNEGLDELPEQRHADREKTDGIGGDNPRNRSNKTRQNFHPTVKPTDLMRQLIRLVTPPGGTVLDPFTGSGSTGKAAILENFNFIGCELTADYLPIIKGRLEHARQVKDSQIV